MRLIHRSTAPSNIGSMLDASQDFPSYMCQQQRPVAQHFKKKTVRSGAFVSHIPVVNSPRAARIQDLCDEKSNRPACL